MPRRALPRQQGLVRRPVRNRMDASAELVRLEYERDSLTRRLAELKERYDLLEGELSKVSTRAAWLHDFRAGETAEQPASRPATVAVTVNVPVAAVKAARRRAGAAT
ncbi:MAG: hypothetical protein ACRCTI_20760 [Beijerinckiaceae bacterium]